MPLALAVSNVPPGGLDKESTIRHGVSGRGQVRVGVVGDAPGYALRVADNAHGFS